MAGYFALERRDRPAAGRARKPAANAAGCATRRRGGRVNVQSIGRGCREGDRGGKKLKGGQWQVRSEIISVEIPDAPAGISEAMKKSGSETVSQCFTDEQLNSREDMARANCTFADFKIGDGSVTGTMTCKMSQGGATSKLSGTYASDMFDYVIESASSMPNVQTIKMTMKMTGRRTGDCIPGK